MTTSSPNCPAWCTAVHHRPDYINHARDIADLNTGTYEVCLELAQYENPRHLGEAVVRIFTDSATESGVTDLVPGLAASIGHILLELDDHQRRAFGVALVDAAALLLAAGAVTPDAPGSPVEREAPPNASGREAQPHTGSTDGR